MTLLIGLLIWLQAACIHFSPDCTPDDVSKPNIDKSTIVVGNDIII